MKNDGTNDDVSEIDPGLHEKLCAYVFGELQGPERTAFEAELAGSSALRAEQARLTATIGLVKGALREGSLDQGLSVGVRRDVLASARRSRFRHLGGRRLVQLCAAAGVVLAGLAAVRFVTLGVGETREVLDGKVARVSEPTAALGERKREAERMRPKAKELEELRELGYVDSPEEVAPSATPAPATETAAVSADEMRALDALGYGGEEAPADVAVQMGLRKADLGDSLAKDGTTLLHYEDAQLSGLNAPGAPAVTSGLDAFRATVPEVALVTIDADSPTENPSGAAAGTPIGEGRVGHHGSGYPSQYVARLSGSGGKPGSAPPARAPVAPPEATRDMLEALGYGGGRDDESDNRLGAVARSSAPALPLAQAQREPLTREQVVVEVERLLAATRLAPGESPRDMFFRYFGDAPAVPAAVQAVSTFAVDVDTASYALTRAHLKLGHLPPRESVRTEEFVNYFKADLAPPKDEPFAIALELAPSLFAKDARTEMLRVGVRARDVADFERKPVALTFVIDNSGSMREGDRLELVKRSLALLLRQLYAGDSVAVVKFSNEAAVVTPALPATRRGELEGLIGALPIEGGTNVEAGLRLGYQLAESSLQRNAVNRVVLCSDGVGNIGETSAQGLLALVEEARAKGVYLNTVGVGMGNHNDAFLEKLADEGDGVCNYVDSDAEAKRVFVDGLASALQPVARDVKIQVEFDPAQVESWRLLGYENRALRTQDFRNDKIDAGEVNAGHQVSALYELVRRPSPFRGDAGGPLATVRLRYKAPFAIDGGKEGGAARAEAEKALELERTLSASAVLPGFAAASNGTQRSVLVAQFAEVLRRSVHARGDSLATLVREAQRLDKALGDPDFTEFVSLLALANPLLDARAKHATPKVQALLDELAQANFELARRARLADLQVAAADSAEEREERLGMLATELGEGDEAAQHSQELRERIERLEQAVRAELGLGPTPLDPATLELLRDLGYPGTDK